MLTHRGKPIVRCVVGLIAITLGLLVCLGGTATGALLDDFDTTSPGVTNWQANQPPAAAVVGGGPSGNYLLLINDTINNQRNHYVYDLTDPGAYSTISADFDFLGFSADQPADGLAVIWVPTSIYGPSGNGPDSFQNPNFPGTFGLGFHTYPGGTNNVSVHWNGQTLSTGNVDPAVVSFRNGEANHARVDVQQMGNGSNVTVELTGDVVGAAGGPRGPVTAVSQYVSGLVPYESRMQFTGRSGGANMTIALDNIDVQYPTPYVPPPTISANYLIQDFDSLGTTLFTAVQGNADSTPGPFLYAGGPTGNYLRLINDGVGSQSNRIAFDRAPDGGVSDSMQVTFDFLGASNIGGKADGFSLVLLPTASQGKTGAGPSSSEEPNLAGALGIGFDTYFNGNTDDEGDNDVSVHWDGALVDNIGNVPVDLAQGVYHRAVVTAEHVPGGSRVTVAVTPDIHGTPGPTVTIYDDVIPGMLPYDYRAMFAGRTGGATMNLDLDNIVSSQLPGAAAPVVSQNFEGTGGTAYEGHYFGSGSPPTLVEEPGNTFLRLLDSQNSTQNAVSFEQTFTGLPPQVDANFDFRLSGSLGADGGSFVLLNTGAYLDVPNVGGWEEPNLTGTFAVGFDIYPDTSEVSLHWDGAEVANVNTMTDFGFDMRGAGWLAADLSITYDAAGAYVTLTETNNGIPLYTDFFIAGMQPYESQVVFGARTGGLNTTFDIDNFNVQFGQAQAIPEPSTWLLLILGSLGLAAYARRRR